MPNDIFTLGFALAIAAVLSFVQLRHAGLALAAAFAPVPGWLAARIFGAPDALPAVLAFLPGFACALFLAEEIASRIATGMERRNAVLDALGGVGLNAGLAVAVIAIPFALFWFVFHAGLAVAAAAIGAGVSAIAIVPLAASLLPFGEAFVTRLNRAHERRERLLDPLTAIVQPRWAMSASGIAIVFAVLGWFGAHPALDLEEAAMPASLILAAACACLALTLDWRRAAGLLAALVLVLLIGLWGFELVHPHPAQPDLLLLALCACFAPVFLMAAETGRHAGEDAQAASVLALLRKGPALVFFFAAAAAMLSVQLADAPLTAVFCAMLVFGAACGLFFLPAIAAALETLIPRRSTIEARYRIR